MLEGMDLVSGLQDLHLTESEARVYIALLAMEAGTPLSLANTTGLKRPTVYLILETLRRKRLAGLTFRGKKTFFSVEPPSRLLRHLDEQRQTALELLPILKAMIRQPCGRAVIRYFDHHEDIQRFWREETWQAQQSDYLSSMVEWSDQFPGMNDEFEERVRTGKIRRSRELVSNNRINVPFFKTKHHSRRHIRVLPPGYQCRYDVCLWENNVSLYSYTHRYMLVVTDDALVNVFHTLFEFAWNSSMTIAEFFKKNQKVKEKNRH